MTVNYAELIDGLVPIVEAAGREILEVYATDFDVETKDDESPLTKADLASNRAIMAGLEKLAPQYPVISEESAAPAFAVRQGWERYWLVDPLDGTKEFIKKNGEFTVNIALIDGHQPVLGIVGVPAQDVVFTGIVADGIAEKRAAGKTSRLSGRTMDPGAELTIVASRSHGGDRLEAYLAAIEANFRSASRTPVGSSLKLCILAEGRADLYPRLGPTSEWDIGAAQAVLEAAGGAVWRFDRQRLDYNAKESLLNPEFVAVADAGFDWWGSLPPLD
jgi:3'(2'), 5'-bisphosphate nucleotidase